MRPFGWALIQPDWCPYKEIRTQRDTRTPMHRGKTMWGQRKRAAIYKPRREASGKTKPAGTFMLDFQTPEL